MHRDIKMIFFLITLSTISILILSFGQIIFIKQSDGENIKIYKRVLDIYEIDFKEEDIKSIFLDNFKKVEKDRVYYISTKVNRESIVVITEGPGLWSVIRLLIVIDSSREKLINVTVLSQGETPGLGGRIEEEDFLNQFRGVKIRPTLLVVINSKEDNEVDGITGATATSEAIEDIINLTIEDLDRSYGEEFYVTE